MPRSKQTGAATTEFESLRIFLETASFGHTQKAIDATGTRAPQVGDIGLALETGASDDGRDALVRLTASSREDQDPDYSFRITMLGLLRTKEGFKIEANEGLQLSGVRMLFPYLREAVSSITGRGRFGPIHINPVDPQQFVKAAKAVSVKETSTTSPPIAKRPSRRKN